MTPPSPRSSSALLLASREPRFVLGITGASGAAYALRTLELLALSGATVHVVVTDYGRRLLGDEAQVRGLSAADFLPHLAQHDASVPLAPVCGLRQRPPGEWDAARDFPDIARRIVIHPNKDVGAVIASGGYLHDGMVVVPCSSSSLGAIATGSGSNLLTRAAMVALKERRPLIVCHRESPLSLIDIENMRSLALAGAVVCPTNPGLYLLPTSVEEIVDFIAGKILDLLGIEHGLARWGGTP